MVILSIFPYILRIYMIIHNTCMLYTLSLQIHQKHVFFGSYQHFHYLNEFIEIGKWRIEKHRITLDLLISIKILFDVIDNTLYSTRKWRNQIRRQTKGELFFLLLSVSHIEIPNYTYGKKITSHEIDLWNGNYSKDSLIDDQPIKWK